jgi:hypothetical protein
MFIRAGSRCVGFGREIVAEEKNMHASNSATSPTTFGRLPFRRKLRCTVSDRGGQTRSNTYSAPD